jgi:iron complex outermembrane recepter protein
VRRTGIKWWLLCSACPLAIVMGGALGSEGARAQATTEQRSAERLRQIEVVRVQRRTQRRGAASRRPAPLPAPTPETGPGTAPKTPLNTGTVAESASRLGLPAREVPATVEVIDHQTLEDRGLRTTTEAVQAAVGVTAGDPPGAPASLSMRGYTYSDINILYNGIKTGPHSFTSRIMETGNLDRIEILKGPASLLSGYGATGGAVNYVTKAPHTGPVRNELLTLFDSFGGYRVHLGSGGSTTVKGLDYRFDVTRGSNIGFIDDTSTKLLNVSGQLDYRVTDDFKVWGAAEYKEDKNRFYWGTPLVPANFPGIVPTSGVVSGMWTQNYPGPFDFAGPVGPRNPVTVDARTLRTTYNVLDNDSGAKELWLRAGFDWNINRDVKVKSQVYWYKADRKWFNNEINAFNDSPTPTAGLTGEVYRERFSVYHDQKLAGNITDLIFNSNIAGMDNRFVATLAASTLQFDTRQDTLFTSDTVSLVNPSRGFYGPEQTRPSYVDVDNVSLSVENRLKVTPTFALMGGLRAERIWFERQAFNVNGTVRCVGGRCFPLSADWSPVTGRIGYTWEALPGLMFYSQYATAADASATTLFALAPNQPLDLTTSRTFETGVKHLFWNGRAEWIFSAFDIERRNVYSTRNNQTVLIAGKVASRGVEFAAAVRPTEAWKIWGNIAYVDARFLDFTLADGTSFTGNVPPNVPRIVANAGTSYRFPTWWPVEVGGVVRHVGDRFHLDDNFVIMNAYTVADLFAYVDINRKDIPWRGVDQARIIFRVRNVTDKTYAVWGDYSDQIMLGTPRAYEVATSFKW